MRDKHFPLSFNQPNSQRMGAGCVMSIFLYLFINQIVIFQTLLLYAVSCYQSPNTVSVATPG